MIGEIVLTGPRWARVSVVTEDSDGDGALALPGMVEMIRQNPCDAGWLRWERPEHDDALETWWLDLRDLSVTDEPLLWPIGDGWLRRDGDRLVAGAKVIEHACRPSLIAARAAAPWRALYTCEIGRRSGWVRLVGEGLRSRIVLEDWTDPRLWFDQDDVFDASVICGGPERRSICVDIETGATTKMGDVVHVDGFDVLRRRRSVLEIVDLRTGDSTVVGGVDPRKGVLVSAPGMVVLGDRVIDIRRREVVGRTPDLPIEAVDTTGRLLVGNRGETRRTDGPLRWVDPVR